MLSAPNPQSDADRSPHSALAALDKALMTQRVNFVLDVDIRSSSPPNRVSPRSVVLTNAHRVAMWTLWMQAHTGGFSRDWGCLRPFAPPGAHDISTCAVASGLDRVCSTRRACARRVLLYVTSFL